MLGKQDEIKNVINLLARTIRLEHGSLCFCGNGMKFSECCGSSAAHNFIFTEKVFERVKGFATAFDWNVDTIPAGIWKLFESSALERLPCLYPQCGSKPVSCHLIPENILRTNYGGHCKEYRITDGSNTSQFVETTVNRAGCLLAFCSDHDNRVFQQIDEFRAHSLSIEQQFLFAFKAVAFSLRKTQILLAMDSQVEIAKPFLHSANPHTKKVGTTTLDCTHLHEQYVRFTIFHSLWRVTLERYYAKDWGSLIYFHRVIQRSQPLFVAGVVNPSHDLKGVRMKSNVGVAITCTLFAKDGQIHVFLACVDDASKRLYHRLFRQMNAATDEVFVTVMNNLLTSCKMNAFLLPNAFEASRKDMDKMEFAHSLSATALKTKGQIFNLTEANRAVEFITTADNEG